MSIDYFGKYFTSESFDFSGLINDDFMAPIRLLFQHQHYISSAKLLMIFIDSIGYVEYGDTSRNPFRQWLDRYAQLEEVGITSEELWEHRNSLLHMSNLDSRKVVAGKVKRLMLYVGELPEGMSSKIEGGKLYNLKTLILTVASGCERWFKSYDADRSKIDSFVERYDQISSDNRMMRVILNDED